MPTDTPGPVRALVERAMINSQERWLISQEVYGSGEGDDIPVEAEEAVRHFEVQLAHIRSAADELDAQLDPEALTVAYLVGANRARQRTRWPQGDEEPHP